MDRINVFYNEEIQKKLHEGGRQVPKEKINTCHPVNKLKTPLLIKGVFDLFEPIYVDGT